MVGKASFWYKILHQFWAFWKAERNLLKYIGHLCSGNVMRLCSITVCVIATALTSFAKLLEYFN